MSANYPKIIKLVFWGKKITFWGDKKYLYYKLMIKYLNVLTWLKQKSLLCWGPIMDISHFSLTIYFHIFSFLSIDKHSILLV